MTYPDLDPAGVSPRILNRFIFPKDDFFIANPSIEEVSNSGIFLLTVSGFDSVLPIESFKKIFRLRLKIYVEIIPLKHWKHSFF